LKVEGSRFEKLKVQSSKLKVGKFVRFLFAFGAMGGSLYFNFGSTCPALIAGAIRYYPAYRQVDPPQAHAQTFSGVAASTCPDFFA
jgi:hypothetical protein